MDLQRVAKQILKFMQVTKSCEFHTDTEDLHRLASLFGQGLTIE